MYFFLEFSHLKGPEISYLNFILHLCACDSKRQWLIILTYKIVWLILITYFFLFRILLSKRVNEKMVSNLANNWIMKKLHRILANKSNTLGPFLLLPPRRQVSCRCTCSWSATQQKKCTGPIKASTGLASATALITLASSSIQTPGLGEAEVHPQSPLRPPSRWTPPTILPSSSVQSMNKCPPHRAEAEDEKFCEHCRHQFDLPGFWHRIVQ